MVDSRGLMRFPWISSLLCSAACLIFFIPAAETWLQYDRPAIANGQAWRLFTGHLTHWNLDHLVWDVVVLAVLGAWCERTGLARIMMISMIVSAAAISMALWFLKTGIEQYRGLSGIDSTLFMMLTILWLRREWAQSRYARFGLIGVASEF